MSIKSRIKEMNNMFSAFDDTMDKYTQIIALGKKNIGLNEKDKNDKNRIYGCASMAWVKVKKNKDFFSIQTDSDTFIVRGLLNILQYIINDASKGEICSLKIEDILLNIGLDKSITSQRTNGFLSALQKINKEISAYE